MVARSDQRDFDGLPALPNNSAMAQPSEPPTSI